MNLSKTVPQSVKGAESDPKNHPREGKQTALSRRVVPPRSTKISRITSEEGSKNSTGAVVLVLVLTPTTHSSSKGQKGPPSWPVTQILKQGPAVALASVSSNLPAPQRRSTLTG